MTCPTCQTPDALVLFDGVGTICTECGEATRAITSYPDEEVSS